MKSFILLILGIITVLLVAGGVAGYSVMHELGIGIQDLDSATVNKIVDKVSNVASSESSDSSSGDSSDSGGDVINKIVHEEVKPNSQNGEGSYRQVTYSDGGFRQYDTESGELIGSSYQSDQDKLPSME